MGNSIPFPEVEVPGIEVKTSKIEDCFEFGPILREDDRKEAELASGRDATSTLASSFLSSERCYSVYHKGKPLFMFGVCPYPGAINVGVVWLLGTDEINKIPKTFLKESKEWINHMSKGYMCLTNAIWEKNKMHLKWIEHCGGVFTDTIPNYGASEETFIQFVRYTDV